MKPRISMAGSLGGGIREGGEIAYSEKELDAYFGSYIGMEGNPAAAVWFCENTPHTGAATLSGPLAPREAPAAWDRSFRQQRQVEMARWQTQQKIARIMVAARRAVLGARACGWEPYFRHHLFAPQGGEFKLCLFPLPTSSSGNRSWSSTYGAQPALNPQSRFIELCRGGGRFQFIARLRRHMRPKVIVCLGARHADDFLRGFEFSHVPGVEHILQPADLPKTLRVHVDGDTALVICPALAGAAGLSSDVLLDAMGGYIAQWLVPADFPPLLKPVRCGPGGEDAAGPQQMAA